jgi:hypothetical protein
MDKLWEAIHTQAAARPDEPAIMVFDAALETALTWQQLQHEVRGYLQDYLYLRVHRHAERRLSECGAHAGGDGLHRVCNAAMRN